MLTGAVIALSLHDSKCWHFKQVCTSERSEPHFSSTDFGPLVWSAILFYCFQCWSVDVLARIMFVRLCVILELQLEMLGDIQLGDFGWAEERRCGAYRPIDTGIDSANLQGRTWRSSSYRRPPCILYRPATHRLFVEKLVDWSIRIRIRTIQLVSKYVSADHCINTTPSVTLQYNIIDRSLFLVHKPLNHCFTVCLLKNTDWFELPSIHSILSFLQVK